MTQLTSVGLVPIYKATSFWLPHCYYMVGDSFGVLYVCLYSFVCVILNNSFQRGQTSAP